MAENMQQLYQQVILDHSRARSGEGQLETHDGSSFQVNPTCGDECTVSVKLNGNTIEEMAWSGRGCSISQASLSVMYEMVDGESLQRADQLGELFGELMRARGKELSAEQQEQLEDMGAFAGVAKYPARIKCALLGWMALRDALIQAQDGTNERSSS